MAYALGGAAVLAAAALALAYLSANGINVRGGTGSSSIYISFTSLNNSISSVLNGVKVFGLAPLIPRRITETQWFAGLSNESDNSVIFLI